MFYIGEKFVGYIMQMKCRFIGSKRPTYEITFQGLLFCQKNIIIILVYSLQQRKQKKRQTQF